VHYNLDILVVVVVVVVVAQLYSSFADGGAVVYSHPETETVFLAFSFLSLQPHGRPALSFIPASHRNPAAKTDFLRHVKEIAL